jgi:hypothetical protein
MDVDEPRRNNQPPRVDLGARAAGDFANGRDAPVLNRHVGKERRIAGSVNNAAVPNDQIVGCRRSFFRCRRRLARDTPK